MRRRQPLPATTSHAAAIESAAGDFLTFAREGREDRSRMRWAVGAAALVHLALFLLTFPHVAAVVEEPEPPDVLVLFPPRFKEPLPPPPSETLPPAQRQVPIPDPTPDLPEPIRPPVELTPRIELADPILTGIPEAPPPPLETGPLRVGGAVAPPTKLFAPSPRYPEIARQAREQGLVIVEAVIDESGAVVRAEIVKGLRFGLNEAALDAIRRWRFEPATLGGKPVAVVYNLTINFQLR